MVGLTSPAKESALPLFVYTMTRGGQSKTVELRKSNPQGWLLSAVREASPEVASRSADRRSQLGLLERVGQLLLGKIQLHHALIPRLTTGPRRPKPLLYDEPVIRGRVRM